MDLTTYTPGRAMQDLRNEMNRLFGYSPLDPQRDFSAVETSQWIPAVDIREESGRFVVEADVPGVDPKDIEVTMGNGILTIRGERKHEETRNENGYQRVERSRGVFYRRFALPDTADPEAIRARGHNGVLEIEIGKREAARPRRIEVKT